MRGVLHGAQIEAVRLGELIDRVKHRSGQIEGELAEISKSTSSELRSTRDDADGRFQLLDGELATRQEAVETARLQLRAGGPGRCGPRATSSARSRRRGSRSSSR